MSDYESNYEKEIRRRFSNIPDGRRGFWLKEHLIANDAVREIARKMQEETRHPADMTMDELAELNGMRFNEESKK